MASHFEAKEEIEIQIETAVQEKNITFPTSSKLAIKVIDNCRKITKKKELSNDKPC